MDANVPTAPAPALPQKTYVEAAVQALIITLAQRGKGKEKAEAVQVILPTSPTPPKELKVSRASDSSLL